MELVAALPTWYLFTLVIGLGLIIGSFLNVVTYRFHTGRSINGASHCLSCAEGLRWYELFPVMSYLALRGRCRHCASFIPVHYALVEAACAGLFLLVFLSQTNLLVIGIEWVMVSLLLIITVYDMRHLIIPDELVVAMSVVAGGIFFATHSAATLPLLGEMAVGHVFGALCAAAVYWSLWRYSGGRWMGLGDAKLALPLGFLVGVANVFSLVVLSFWIGAVVSILLLGWQRLQAGTTSLHQKRNSITIKSEVPFAPFIVAAFLLTYYFGVDVLEIMMF